MKEVLYKCKLSIDMVCPLCNLEEESVTHLLLALCNFAQMVWHISPFRLDMRSIERWIGRDDGREFWAAVGNILWQLWLCRNEVVIFNDRLDSRPDVVCQNAVRAAADFLFFIKANEGSNDQRREIDRQGRQCGSGMVVRDWQGCFIAARAVHKYHAMDNGQYYCAGRGFPTISPTDSTAGR